MSYVRFVDRLSADVRGAFEDTYYSKMACSPLRLLRPSPPVNESKLPGRLVGVGIFLHRLNTASGAGKTLQALVRFLILRDLDPRVIANRRTGTSLCISTTHDRPHF